MPPAARIPRSAIASSSPVVMPGRAAFISSVKTAEVILPLRRIVSISRGDFSVTMAATLD